MSEIDNLYAKFGIAETGRHVLTASMDGNRIKDLVLRKQSTSDFMHRQGERLLL